MILTSPDRLTVVSLSKIFESRHRGKVQIVVEDGSYDVAESLTAERALLDREGVDGVLTFGTPIALALLNETERQGIKALHITMNPDLIGDKKNSINFVMDPKRQVKILAPFIKPPVIVLQTENEAMLRLSQAVLEFRGGQVIDVPTDDLDLRSQLLKVKSAGPSTIFLALLPPHLSIAGRRLREFGVKATFLGGNQVLQLDELRNAAGSLDETIISTVLTEGGKKLLDEYRSHYEGGFSPDGMIAFDGLEMLLQSIRGVPEQAVFEGALGRYEKIAPATFAVPLVAKTVKEVLPN